MHVIGDYRCTPHLAVRLILRGNCRKVMVRLLKAPKNFAAVLPHGPPNRTTDEPFYREVDNPEVGIDELGVMMYDSLERNLAAVAGLDYDDTEAHSGRSLGPKFVWKDLCGTPASTKCRSSDVSRAWGLVADWLRQLDNIMALQAKQTDGWDQERNATGTVCHDGWDQERNATRTVRPATEPSNKQTAAPRNLQREGDILR